jgi:hypothetical protein
MSNLYVIKGMGRGFDGLVVECETGLGFDKDGVHRRLYPITRIINHNAIFGDRNVSFPVPPNGLYIDSENLAPFNDELREFSSKNPNGAYLSETRFKRHSLEAVLVEYERLLTVTILETEHEDGKYNDTRGRDITKTRYTQNYLKDFDVVRAAVDLEVKKGDLDDLIFTLTELKEQELNANG